MTHTQASVKAQLFSLFQGFFSGAALADLGAKGRKLGVVSGQGLGQRVIGGNTKEGRAHQRIGTGGVDVNLSDVADGFGQGPTELQAPRFANPVLLHQLDFGRPVIQPINRGQKLVCHIRDFKEPLREFASFDLGARPPTLAVYNLFIGQHRHIDRVPVDHGIFTIDLSRIQHIQKQSLLLAVIFGIAGGEHPAPVQPKAKWLHLSDHVVDVAIRPVFWVATACHGGVFGRHPKRVESHGM